MATLATAQLADLEPLVLSLGDLPPYHLPRPPEMGLVMVQGRMGGSGDPFNLGEMPMSRCVVQLDSTLGFGYVGGRSLRHAELAALCDALLQIPLWSDRVMAMVILPLQTLAQTRKAQQQAETDATQVDFLTLTREKS